MNAAAAHSRIAAHTGRPVMTEREIDRAATELGMSATEQYLAHAYRNAAIAARSYR